MERDNFLRVSFFVSVCAVIHTANLQRAFHADTGLRMVSTSLSVVRRVRLRAPEEVLPAHLLLWGNFFEYRRDTCLPPSTRCLSKTHDATRRSPATTTSQYSRKSRSPRSFLQVERGLWVEADLF